MKTQITTPRGYQFIHDDSLSATTALLYKLLTMHPEDFLRPTDAGMRKTLNHKNYQLQSIGE